MATRIEHFLFLFSLLLHQGLGQNDNSITNGFWSGIELFHSLAQPSHTYVPVTDILPSCQDYNISEQPSIDLTINRPLGSVYESNGLFFEPDNLFESVEVDLWMRATGTGSPNSDIGLATTAHFSDPNSPFFGGGTDEFNFLGITVFRDGRGDVLTTYSFPGTGFPAHRNQSTFQVVLPFDAGADFHHYNFYFLSLPERDNGLMQVRVDGELMINQCSFQPFLAPGDVRILTHCSAGGFCMGPNHDDCSSCPNGTTVVRDVFINGVAYPTCSDLSLLDSSIPAVPVVPAARAEITPALLDQMCPPPQESEDEDQTPLIAGVVVGVVVFCCLLILVLLAVVFIAKKRSDE